MKLLRRKLNNFIMQIPLKNMNSFTMMNTEDHPFRVVF